MLWIFFLVTVAAGAANPLQAGANAQLNKQLGTPVWAGIVVYATGLIGLAIIQLFLRQGMPENGRIAGVNWWAWAGGLISITSTMVGLTLAQKLGSGVFTGLSITAAVGTSVFLDQFGWLGFRQHSASPGRLVGCGLMIAGVWLVSRS